MNTQTRNELYKKERKSLIYFIIVLVISISFIVSFLPSCKKDTEKIIHDGVLIDSIKTYYGYRYIYLYEIDSCEYIGNIYDAYGPVLAHSGTCKFCKERNKLN